MTLATVDGMRNYECQVVCTCTGIIVGSSVIMISGLSSSRYTQCAKPR